MNQMSAAQMNAQMVESLQNVNKVMSQVNSSMNPQQMNQIMRDFAKETEKMGMQQEMMGDAFDMMEDPGTEMEGEEVYNQILGEIGMAYNGDMAAGKGEIANPVAAQPVSTFSHSDVDLKFFALECRG